MSSSAARVWMTSGLPSSRASCDLGGERALLVGARRVVAVVVEAGLADRAAARVRGELAQLVGDRVVVAGRVVGVAADRGEHLVVGLGGGERGAAATRASMPIVRMRVTPGLARRGDQLGLGRRAAVEVGVAVDHSGFGNSGGELARPACRRRAAAP